MDKNTTGQRKHIKKSQIMIDAKIKPKREKNKTHAVYGPCIFQLNPSLLPTFFLCSMILSRQYSLTTVQISSSCLPLD